MTLQQRRFWAGGVLLATSFGVAWLISSGPSPAHAVEIEVLVPCEGFGTKNRGGETTTYPIPSGTQACILWGELSIIDRDDNKPNPPGDKNATPPVPTSLFRSIPR